MGRKTRPSRGKGPSNRGRHKKHKSRETRAWAKLVNRLAHSRKGGTWL